MTTVTDHYRSHLAPVYLWMTGGFDAAIARGETEIDAILPAQSNGGLIVDLGAGFGMHAIPLARRGWPVLAIDSSAHLLDELRRHAGALPVTAVEDDLLSFPDYLSAKAQAILCMGDTLTHLPDLAAVESLFTMAAKSLRENGTFVLSFRDYSKALSGHARFIPVKSDADRIFTCFLDYGAEHIDVHDVLHERNTSTWQLRVSAYRKLRLSPQRVSAALEAEGFTVRVEDGLAGMVRIIASNTENPAHDPVARQ